MSDLRLGRFTLFLALAGFISVAATFFVPAIIVLCAVFSVVVLVTGLMSVRTRVARVGLSLALIVLPGIAALSYYRYEAVPPSRIIPGRGPVEVRFSPNGGCTEAIVAQIAGAKRSVLVQAYYLTSKPIGQALIEARRRGVSVRVILDRRTETNKYTEATFLSNSGVETLVDDKHKIAHDKVIVVDASTLITGSMNFTRAGESNNAENILILHDKSVAGTYADNWNAHARHSHRYARATQTSNSTSEVPLEDE